MEAPVKSVASEKRTIRKASQLRTTLASPYVFQTHWSKLSHEVEAKILDSLTSLFEALPPLVPLKNLQRKDKTTEQPDVKAQTVVKAMRSLIITGINQVTKGLERRQIEAVVLNRPSIPRASVLTDHLKVLSATRDVPVCVLSGLTDRLCPMLNVKQVSVIGFKKSHQCPDGFPQRAYQQLSMLVQRIREVTPIVALPWLHTQAELHEKSAELIKRLFPNGDKQIVQPESESEEGSRKRKAEETLETNKKAKVDVTLESPFSQERETGKDRPIGDSFKYQTANILQIIKGDKKSKKKKKKKGKK